MQYLVCSLNQDHFGSIAVLVAFSPAFYAYKIITKLLGKRPNLKFYYYVYIIICFSGNMMYFRTLGFCRSKSKHNAASMRAQFLNDRIWHS